MNTIPRDSATDFACGKLHGDVADEIGAVSAIAEGDAAIALSKGGARKTYEHTDPNEDSAAFAIGPGGVLVAVADGHGGCSAARIAIDLLLDGPARQWTAAVTSDFRGRWEQSARDQVVAIHEAILAAAATGAALDTARTTLAFAVARPCDDCIAFCSVGDSHIFRVNRAEALDIGYHHDRRDRFLGAPASDRATVIDMALIGAGPIDSAQALVLASDGLSERGIGVDVPESTVIGCVTDAGRAGPALRSLETARTLAEITNTAQRRNRSGDNIATAVAWLGG